MQAANPALAIEHATACTSPSPSAAARKTHYRHHDSPPTSAWHPPSAAEIVLPRLNSIPTAAAVSKNVTTLFSGSSLTNCHALSVNAPYAALRV